jgi:hypothetical protein
MSFGAGTADNIRVEETSVDFQHCPPLQCGQFLRGFNAPFDEPAIL